MNVKGKKMYFARRAYLLMYLGSACLSETPPAEVIAAMCYPQAGHQERSCHNSRSFCHLSIPQQPGAADLSTKRMKQAEPCLIWGCFTSAHKSAERTKAASASVWRSIGGNQKQPHSLQSGWLTKNTEENIRMKKTNGSDTLYKQVFKCHAWLEQRCFVPKQETA